MIWEQPIHAKRNLQAWLEEPDTGFTKDLVQCVLRSKPIGLAGLLQLMDNTPLITMDMTVDSMDSICVAIRSLAPHMDSICMTSGTGIAARFLSKKARCKLLDMSWARAYNHVDFLWIVNAPELTMGNPAASEDRKCLDAILTSRQRRGRRVTVLGGKNFTTLPAYEQYETTRKLLERGLNGTI